MKLKLSNSKRLIINGSPHKDSHTMTLATALFNTDNIIHAYDKEVNSCDDCKYCNFKAGCKFKNDDMPFIIEKIHEADTLVIASPIYFGTLSDQTLKILNRFQQFFSAKFTLDGPYPKIKNLIMINTCGANNLTMFEGVKVTLNILKSLFDAERVEHITVANTDEVPITINHPAIADYLKQLKTL